MKSRLYLFLSYLVVVSSVLTGVSFSRYSTVVSGSGEARVAQAVIEYSPVSATLNDVPITTLESGISISNVMPGDVLIYNFDIKNFNSLLVNQVLLKYAIFVRFSPDPETIPLAYDLTPADPYQSAGGNWTFLGFGPEETHSYTLTVSWDSAETDPAYIGQQQNIQIQIDSEQADSLN